MNDHAVREESQKKNIVSYIADVFVDSSADACVVISIRFDNVSFQYLIKSVNEAWDSSISFDEAQQLPKNSLLSQAL